MTNASQRPPLRASELVGDSWSFLAGHLRSLGPAAAFPVALSVLIGVAALAAGDAELSGTVVMSAQSLVDVAPWTLFGVAWHRLVLLGEPPSVSLEWTRAHSRFALFLLAWRLPWLLPLQPDPESTFASIGLYLPAFLLLAVALAYIQARLSLFLPAAAIERPLSLREAWSRSAGYGGALFWSAFLAGMLGLLLCIPLLFATVALQQSSSPPAKVALVATTGVMQLVFEVLTAGALSFAYMAIRDGWARESGAEPDPPRPR